MGCPVHPQQQDSSTESAVLAECAGHCFSGTATEQSCTAHKLLLAAWYTVFLEQLIVTQCIKKLVLTDHDHP